MNEAELIEGCVSGNPRAQKQLYDMFSGRMMGVCLRYCKSEEEAQDALQEGFVKVFTKIKEFKMDGSFEGWIRRIMVNTSLDLIRKHKKHAFHSDVDELQYMLSDNEMISGKLAAEELLRVLSTLPDGYRIVFNMFAIEGYSHKEIANELGISENTSKSQYSRARAYLRDCIEKLETRAIKREED
ncbi:RNA polymerase sigma factor [Wandonia haliotis]|uniref:RNA polymerase sigma factor n=1 Tax=Wandonia haliotis TaxID=574963 RepID=A0ABP3Y0Q9_9FLAO